MSCSCFSSRRTCPCEGCPALIQPLMEVLECQWSSPCILWERGLISHLYSVCAVHVPFPSNPLDVHVCLQHQQLQAQHLSHAAHGPPVQLPPHPSGLQPPGIPPVTGSGSGLLALGALGSQAHLPVKDEKNHHDLEHRGNARMHWRENKNKCLESILSCFGMEIYVNAD